MKRIVIALFLLLVPPIYFLVVTFSCPYCDFKQSKCEDGGAWVTFVTEAHHLGIRSYRLMNMNGQGYGRRPGFKISGGEFLDSAGRLSKDAWFVYQPIGETGAGILEYRHRRGLSLEFPGITEDCFNIVKDYAKRTRIPTAFVNLGDHKSEFD